MKAKHRVDRQIRAMPDVLSALLSDDLSPWLQDQTCDCGPDVGFKSFAAEQLRKSFWKKYQTGSSEVADAAALKKFLAVNDSCRDWTLRVESSWEEELVGELKRSLYHFFLPSSASSILDSYEAVFACGKVGPGSSIGANGNDFFTKMFSSELTTTSRHLYNSYRRYTGQLAEWNIAEIIRTGHFAQYRIVDGNRVTFVPKTRDISRLICIEPSLNMYAQLGVKQILERRLKSYYGIDLVSQQRKNRELARLGSKYDRKNSSVTIDLSSASDSMSLTMLREVLPASVMTFLESLRSPIATLPNGCKVELAMVSTMGNGFTFPLQTILFSAVVVAAARVYERPLQFPYGNRLGNFGVNGDDIICEKSISRGVLTLLRILGFEVNRDKTFLEGPFRESCGGDFHRGREVRGFYLKSLETPQLRYAAINGLNLWSSRTGVYLPRVIRYLASTVEYLPVPPWENQDAGIKVPKRCLGLMPTCRETGSILYRKIESVATKLYVHDGCFTLPDGCKERVYNPSGLLMAVLNGSITSTWSRNLKRPIMSIAVRLDTSKWRTKRAIAPNWELTHTISGIAPLIERSRNWEIAVLINTGL